jgi:protein O-mannosyl-transferase
MKKNLLNMPSLHYLALLVVGMAVYSNTFYAPFAFDDIPNIASNYLIKSFEYFSHPLDVISLNVGEPTMRFSFVSRLLTFLSFALNFRFGGLNPFGYHILNTSVHVINAILVYLLVAGTFAVAARNHDARAPEASSPDHCAILALLASLLFVGHPIQTQAVTYISQRFTSLATMFYLLTMVYYLRYRLAESVFGKYSSYVIAVLFSVCAMMTKEISFTLPIMIVIYELLFFDGRIMKRILHCVPIFLTCLIIPINVIRVKNALHLGSVNDSLSLLGATPETTRYEYLVTQIHVIVTYLRLFLLPVNQTLDYDYPVYHSMKDGSTIGALMLLLAFAALGVYAWYKSRARDRFNGVLRLISFGIAWFFVTLSIESSANIFDVIYEHRMYLPSVGIFTAAVAALYLLCAKCAIPRRYYLTVIFLVIAGYAVTAYVRNTVWTSSIALWEDAAKKSPYKPRPHYQLGHYYEENRRVEDAFKEFVQAVNLDPLYTKAHLRLEMLYRKHGRNDLADREARTILAIQHMQQGMALVEQSDFGAGSLEFQEANRLLPDYDRVLFNAAVFDEGIGKVKNAVEMLEMAVLLNPGNKEARIRLDALSKRMPVI